MARASGGCRRPRSWPATERVNGWIALIFYLLLAPALWAYIQASLNEVWEQEADPLPGEPAA